MQTDKTFRLRLAQTPGTFARVVSAIAATGVSFGNITTRHIGRKYTYRDITIEFKADSDVETTMAAIRAVEGVVIDSVIDEVMTRHEGGKMAYRGRMEVQTLAELREIYTPGVAQVCMEIHRDPSLARKYTTAGNTVAVISNGTRVLGLGDIGPKAALPVMESKALFYGQFVGLNAVALVIDAMEIESFVETVAHLAPSFAAIHLEDIQTPQCIDIENHLVERLSIPVMHDDQHGTAVVAVAAMRNMLRVAGKTFKDATVAQIGLGAAGLAIAQLVREAGAFRVIGVDPTPSAIERAHACGVETMDMPAALEASNLVCLTTGRAGLLKPEMIRRGQMIMALTNPVPEIESREAILAGASQAVDGRNVNNLLCYPGLLKGAIESGARRITTAMKLAAARAIADAAMEEEILPEPLDKGLHQQVAIAVMRAVAEGGGV